jgi:galactose mutarotase-like enzyme
VGIWIHCQALRAEVLPFLGARVNRLTYHEKDIIYPIGDGLENKASGNSWIHGGMPFLFPFAGRVKLDGEDNKFSFAGHTALMPIHGFLHSAPFDILWQKDSASCLRVFPNELYFPFPSQVTFTYELSKDSLTAVAEIKNIGEQAMPLACGWHPYFQLPGKLEESEAHLTVTNDLIYAVNQGFADRPQQRQLGQVSIKENAFHNLILRGSGASLEIPEDGLRIDLLAELFPYTVLWGEASQTFFCVEPWMNLPNALHFDPGPFILEPGRVVQTTFRMKISRTSELNLKAPPTRIR